jgi:DNA-3-methyladenine glycosylase
MTTNDYFAFLQGAAAEVAPRLLGCLFVRDIAGKQLVGRIVETEAYQQDDAASHSYKGQTPRTDVMFGPAGRLYVYFTYGMHYCMNIVTGKEGEGSAVLIRAIEPLAGIETMRRFRKHQPDKMLTNGPAKVCQALAINAHLNGHDLHHAPLQLETAPPLDAKVITQTTRIGITKAAERPWRFYISHNAYVSKR